MKASLLGAYDIGGLSGVLLRARIRWKLAHKFYENPNNKYDGNRAVIAMVGMFIGLTALLLMIISSSIRDVLAVRYLDLFITQDFVYVTVMWIAFIVVTVATVSTTYYFINDVASLTRRVGGYTLQQARDEIDL